MNRPVIDIHTPDGLRHEAVSPGDLELPLSVLFEKINLPLNTRCGGRGLCRGCLVHLGDADSPLLRSCQIKVSGVMNLGGEVRIPESSVRDNRLNGVSAFEVADGVPAIVAREGVGLSLDIGTTTVAAALWDLQSGKCLASASVANEQRRFGDNVLSRIDHAVAEGGTSPGLQKALVRDSLEPLIRRLCAEAGIATDAITEAVAAGNTVMLHTLAGARMSGFASYPFRPEFTAARSLAALDLGFSADFPIRTAANLGAFVGADIAVGALASGIMASAEPALLIDFGTNGEILLKTRDGYLATATAAGPAFEGGRLSCGAAAGPGVVSSVRREGEKWSLRLSGANGSGRATGISGAAYVDCIAGGLGAGMINSSGRFVSGHPEIRTMEEDGESSKRIYLSRELFISEADVAELIQAKAAIAGGVMALLELAGLSVDQIGTLYIAGGFGYHLHLDHAIAIGLIPCLPMERIRVIGNASLGGASLVLQSKSEAQIECLRAACRVVELNQIESFEDHFIDCMSLQPLLPD